MANPDFIPLDGAPTKNSDFIPLEPTGNEKPLQNRPDDSDLTGTLKNAGTSAIKGLAHTPGFLGDIQGVGKYLADRALAFARGVPPGQVTQQRDAEEAELWKKIDSVPFLRTNPIVNLLRAPSGADIARPVLKRTGEYQPTTEAGRLGAAAGETGLSMIGPGALGGVRSGAQGLSVVPQMLKGAGKAVPGGAIAGAAADAATQVTGDPLAGLVTGALVPATAAMAKPILRPVVAPFVPSMRQGAANRILAKSATDPEGALDTLDKRPAKPGETLGEATLDPGILQAEKGALNTSDHFRAALAERDAARAEQRKTAIEGIAPPADQMAPVKLFRQRLEDIDHATQDTVDRAGAQAKAAHAAIPGAKPFDATGDVLRNIIAEADKAKGAEVSRLYQAIDPEGTLSLVTSGPREAATTLHKAFDPTVSEPNMATPIIAKMVNLPEVMPFRKLMDLDKTITSKMAEAARSGDRVGHGQLVELKGSVQSAIDSAIENQVKWQQGAVARGELSADATVEARLRQWRDEHYQRRDADQGAATGTYGMPGGGSSGPSGSFRAKGQSERGPANPPGDQGIPSPDEPNFDAEAAGRLAAAKEGHAERAQTYRQGPVAPVLKTTGFSGQYAMPAAKVPAAAFPKGDTGYANARAFLKAAGDNPDALPALQDTAISRLREAMPEGELTPKALAKWKQDYAPALKAIDEQTPGFSDRFSTAANATDALEQAALHRKNAIADAQKGIAAKFLKLTNPNEVGDTLMSMAKAKDGPTQISHAMNLMDDAGKAGAQHALAQAILRGHQNANGMLSGAELRNFITKNKAALEAAYGKNGADVLGMLAEDAERYQQATGIQSSKLGSDSFSNFMRWAKDRGVGHASIGALLLESGHFLFNGDLNTALSAGAVAALGILRGRGIRKINDLVEVGMTNPEVGAAMMRSALDAKGQFNTEALEALAKAVARASAQNETLQGHARVGRAHGGKVSKVDHAAKATQLLRMAEKAKKAHGRSTESLLKYPDELISGALRLANQDR